MVQNIHYHSKGEEREHGEEMLDKSETKGQQGKPQLFIFMSDINKLF